MKITTEIPDSQIDELAKEIMNNFPASWDYENGKFIFFDEEEEKEYNVSTADISKALPKFIQLILDKKLHFYGVETLEDILNACNWDMPISDALIQFTLFGDVIYG